MKISRLSTGLGAITVVAGLAVACGTSTIETSQTKIIGGQEVPNGQNDARRLSTVALTTDYVKTPGTPSTLDADHSFCSGTIVGRRAIMTAAHCIQQMDATTHEKLDALILPNATDFLVYFGTRVSRTGTWIRAVRAIPHPDWSPEQTLSPSPTSAPNDIGLIILESDIPADARIATIGDAADTLPGNIQLAGFGVTASRDNNDTGILRQVDVPVSNSAANIHRFTVGSFGRGACAGDSGGPAYMQKDGQLVVIGATSTGAEFAGRCLGLLNNYTDARYYKDWVATTAASQIAN